MTPRSLALAAAGFIVGTALGILAAQEVQRFLAALETVGCIDDLTTEVD